MGTRTHIKSAMIYRFRDLIVTNTDINEDKRVIVYMTKQQTIAYINALQKYLKDVEMHHFGNSDLEIIIVT